MIISSTFLDIEQHKTENRNLLFCNSSNLQTQFLSHSIAHDLLITQSALNMMTSEMCEGENELLSTAIIPFLFPTIRNA